MKTRSVLYIAWHYYPLNLWPVRKVSVCINTCHAFHLGRCTITWLHYEWPTWCALRYIQSSTHADIISRAACIRWPQWTLPLPTLCNENNAAIVPLSPSRLNVSESVCRTEQVHFRFEQGHHVNEHFCVLLPIAYCEIYCLSFCSDWKFSESQNGTVWVAWIMGDMGHWTWWMWLLCNIKLNNLYWSTILWLYSLILIKFDLYWEKKLRICNRVSWWTHSFSIKCFLAS